jgi:hypothetical protein
MGSSAAEIRHRNNSNSLLRKLLIENINVLIIDHTNEKRQAVTTCLFC